jgi:hypothetical protein
MRRGPLVASFAVVCSTIREPTKAEGAMPGLFGEPVQVTQLLRGQP